ncbi:hypothetical protein FRC15_000434 [Serendipita sp. 397]|nr:hypothetical protein FRC15_000434 [Serendipita sp. 397]
MITRTQRTRWAPEKGGFSPAPRVLPCSVYVSGLTEVDLKAPLTPDMDKYGITRADNIVIVMGLTGAGKNTFIDYATGAKGHGIGHSLRSSTSDITVRRANIDNQSFVFVDTSGLNDTMGSDYETLAEIAEFLVKAATTEDPRTVCEPMRKHCNAKRHYRDNDVAVAAWRYKTSTGGPVVHHFLAKMIEAGCDIARFGNSAHSARASPQAEKLKSTEVGITLNKQLDRLVRERKEASFRLEQMSRQQIDEGARHALELELRAMKKFIQEKSSDLQRLKRSVLSRICKSFVESQSPVIQGPAQILPNQLPEE